MHSKYRALAVFTALVSLLPVACDRWKGGASAVDGGPVVDSGPFEAPPEARTEDPETPPPDELPDPPSPDETPRRPLSTVEAHRATLQRLDEDRSLLAHRELLTAHFGGKLPSPLETQTALLGGDRRAVLIAGGPKDRRPIIVVLDGQGKVLWTKERPLAGIAPGVSEIVILPGPDGEVRISWYDPPTQLVAMRAWDAGGGILADFQVLAVEACSALSGLYWPGRGFLLVAAQPLGPARAQVLDEGGRLAWGSAGKALPWSSRAGAPVTLALDAPRTVMAFQVGDAPGASPREVQDHAFAARFDAAAGLLWPKPLDLGAAPRPAPGRPAARIGAAGSGEGSVRITLPQGAARRALDITSDGIVTVPPAR